ncbi:MAG TPA: hypothetical protein DCW74_01130 [Alteromonas australica]|uniref:Uncharacterized protein n=1 Tax=Alteromonas australica TaxID=589873 RepID=A0A350NZ55_9ALTE|nr:hypothetical protein [Alteromonas australica]
MKSCLVRDFNTDGIDNEGRGTVISCTVQTDFRKSAGRGIFANNVYNSIFHNNSGADLTVGIRGATAVKHCISYGVDGDDDFTGTETNCFGFSEVDDGFTLPFFDESANNFKPVKSSRAYDGGAASVTGSSFELINDLSGRTIDHSKVSIGCFQYSWPGGSKVNAVSQAQISKIAGIASTLVAKTIGR